MKNIKSFNEYNEGANYTNEYPLNKQSGMPMNVEDLYDNDFYQKDNKFQQVQEIMKTIIKPILLKKNSNIDDNDLDKSVNKFFELGNNKTKDIKAMVDNCKDINQCAQDIVDKYYKYVKINFGLKDEVNNTTDGIRNF